MFENIILDIYLFNICPHFPIDTIIVFSEFQIFYQKVLKPTKTTWKDHSLHNTVSLKKSHPFYNLNSIFVAELRQEGKTKTKQLCFLTSCICIYLIEVSCLSTVTFRNLSWKCFKRGKIFIQQDFKITQNFQTISSKQYPAKDFHFFVGM